MTSQAKFTVAIVGGGIGGLVLAVALAKSGVDFDVDIYESTAAFSEVGAGIGLWPRVWNTLVGLGLEEDLKSKSTSLGGGGKMSYYKADQTELVYAGQATQSMRSFHRAEFLQILEKNIPASYRAHFNKRLVLYEDNPSEPVTLHFKDGSTAKCDVLIGADGIKSAVRKTMFTNLAIKADDEIPADAFKAEYPEHPSATSPVCYMGRHTIVLSYPISQGQMVNCVAMVATPSARGTVYEGPWASEADNDEMISHYAHWSPEVYCLLKAMKNPSKWAINEVRGLPTFVSGRVALLGDAAHAMTPHLASGAGQAIEDALVLAKLLAQPETQKSTIPTTLTIYDSVRRPFSQNIQELSFTAGEISWLDGPRVKPYVQEGRIPQSVLEEVIREDLTGVQRWTWTTDPRDDVVLAVRKLKLAVEGV